jgi:hypothetical protein
MVRVTNKEREAISGGCGWKPRIMALNRQDSEMKKDTRYNCLISISLTGAPGKIRTCDLRIRSPFTKLTSRQNTRQEYLIIKGY